jgi:hypothetical protein
MVAEWVLRRLQKLDRQVLVMLKNGIEGARKDFVDPLSYKAFATEEMHNRLKMMTPKQVPQQTEIPYTPKMAMDKAMKKY